MSAAASATASVPHPKIDWSERRDGDRVEAEIDVDFESDHNFFQGFAENISEGGLFMATYAPRPVGEQLTIRFTLPGVDRPIETVAEVRWSREMNPASDTPPGVGLKFLTLSDQDKRLVEQFVGHRPPLFFDE